MAAATCLQGAALERRARHAAPAALRCAVPQVSMQQDEEDTDQHKDWAPVHNVYALGDCCADLERPLPALAQAGMGAWGGGGWHRLDRQHETIIASNAQFQGGCRSCWQVVHSDVASYAVEQRLGCVAPLGSHTWDALSPHIILAPSISCSP